MIDLESVLKRSAEILTATGANAILSAQAKAVAAAIVEAVNADKKNGVMKRPSLEEVKLCAAKCGLPESEAEAFFAHFESNGWYVGRVPMKRWTQALCVTWKQGWERRRGNGSASPLSKLKATKELLEVAERKCHVCDSNGDTEGFRKAREERNRLRGIVAERNREVAGA